MAFHLKRQIENNTDQIETKWIYQGANDKIISEKDIYKKAKELEIINTETFNELYELYTDRNRVVHRFIISEIILAEVEVIAYKYYNIRERVKVIMDDIESEQLRLGVGMVTIDEKDPGNKSGFLNSGLAKIGKVDYFD